MSKNGVRRLPGTTCGEGEDGEGEKSGVGGGGGKNVVAGGFRMGGATADILNKLHRNHPP
jgi:hypothetical protein